jgi:hypothetical protein
MDVIWVTERNKPTVDVYQAAITNPGSVQHKGAPASWTAEIGIVGWQALNSTLSDTDIPSHVFGATTAERRLAWAEIVYRHAERRYPWPAVRGDMIRALTVDPNLGGVNLTDLRTFLTNQRTTIWNNATPVEFDLGESHIASFTPQPLSSVVPHLEAFQRLYALVPRRDGWVALRALWLAGFRAARDVSRIGLQRYLFRLEQSDPGALDPSIARGIWRRARRRAQRAANFWR